MLGFGLGELTLLVLVVLLFFGGKHLPKVGSSMGKAYVNFKKGLEGEFDGKENELSGEEEKKK